MGFLCDVNMKRNSKLQSIEDFKKKYSCSFIESQLQEKINEFIKSNENSIQEPFFNVHTKDKIFELLKKEERTILVNYFNSKKDIFLKDIQNTINSQMQTMYDFNQLTSDIINIENGSQVYKSKIIREIEIISKDKNSFRIDFLTIMVIGICGVGKSTLINKFLQLFEKNAAAPTGTGKYVTTKI